MGAPVAVVAAVTSTRTGRRLIGLFAGALAVLTSTVGDSVDGGSASDAEVGSV